MRSSSAKKKIVIGRKGTYTERYYTPYRKNFSQITTRQGRDNASFTVSSYSDTTNFGGGVYSIWTIFRQSQSFNAIQRMFQQVSIQGVGIQMSVSNVTPVKTDTAQGSVALLHGWDRDGVLTHTQKSVYQTSNIITNVNETGSEKFLANQQSVYKSLSQTSSCYMTSLGVTSGTRTIGTSIWANSMAEKSLYVSTDMLKEEFVNETWDTSAYTRIQQWNPTLMVCLQPGYVATFKISFKFHVVCKGVRIIALPDDGQDGDDEQITQGDIKPQGDAWCKQFQQTAEYTVGTQVKWPNIWNVVYYRAAPGQFEAYMKNYRPREIVSVDGTVTHMRLKTPVMSSVMFSQLEAEQYLNGQTEFGGIEITTPERVGMASLRQTRTVVFLCSVVKDSDYQQSLKYNKTGFVTNPVMFNYTGIEKFEGYHSTGSANLHISDLNHNSYGAITEFDGQLERLSVRVDGSQCYSEELGGIYAEGYIDLNGPDTETEGYENAAVAFTRIGDTTANSSQEANNTLLEYNIANTGPQFEEVSLDTKTVTVRTLNVNWRDKQGRVTPSTNQEIEKSDQITNVYDMQLSYQSQALASTLKIKVEVNTVLYNNTNQALISNNSFDLGYQGEDPKYQLTYYINAAYGQSVSVPYLIFTGEYGSSNIPRFQQLFTVWENGQDAQIRQISGYEAVQLIAFFNSLALSFRTIWVEGTTAEVWQESSWTVPMEPIIPLDIPLQASKFWQRIKGFFRSAWRVIKGVIPRAAQVASAVIPPPYGTVVAGIGAGVTAIDNVINAVAAGQVQNQALFGAQLQVETTDHFTIIPQFYISPRSDGVVQDVLGESEQWVSQNSFEVNLTNSLQNVRCSQQIDRSTSIGNAVRDYHRYLLSSNQSVEDALMLQQRAKFTFFKECTREQAANFKSVLALGCTQDIDYTEKEEYNQQEFEQIYAEQ